MKTLKQNYSSIQCFLKGAQLSKQRAQGTTTEVGEGRATKLQPPPSFIHYMEAL